MNDPLAFANLVRADGLIRDVMNSAGGNHHQRALGFVRRTVQRALNLDPEAAQRRWGSMADSITKAAVPALGLADTDADATAFLGLGVERSIVGRLQGLRRVPFNTRTTKITGGAIAYWVSEAQPRPLSRPSLAGETLPSATLNALIVATRESVGKPAAERLLQDDLLRATTAVLDATFLSDDAAVPNGRPGGILAGVPTVSSTGNLADDLAALCGVFGGDLQTASLITTPAVAVRLAFASGGNPQIDVGPNGGNLFGFPLLTTRELEPDSNGERIVIVDGSGITANWTGISLDQSEATALAMADDPTSPAQMVSMFQTSSVAFKTTIYANWAVSRSGAVAQLVGV